MGVAPATLWSWGGEQVDLLLASAQIERERGSMGEDLADAMADDGDPNNYSGRFYWKPIGPKINWAEKIVGDAQEAFYKGSEMSRAGHVWGVERVERPSVGLPLVDPDDEGVGPESDEQ